MTMLDSDGRCAMGLERRVKLRRHGHTQTVDIPPEFELAGEDAIMRKEGDRLVIELRRERPNLLELLKSWEPLDEEFSRRR